jgi:hypothetical protein
MARDTLFTSPKFRRLVRELGISRPLALGHLELLWRTAYAAGDSRIGDAADVEDAAEWQGEAGVLAAALHRVGFLDDHGPGAVPEYHVHDLHDHAPKYVKERMAREAERRARGVTILELKRRAGLARWAQRVASGKAEESTAGEGADAQHALSTRSASKPPPSPSPTPTPQGKEKKERFAPPSLDEVQKYVIEKGYTFSAAAFVAFYESKGWKVGDQPMKSWRAACVTWQGREAPQKQAAATSRAGLGPAAGPQAPADVVYAGEPGSPERRAALEAAGYHTPTDEELEEWKRRAEVEIAEAYARRPSSPRDVPSPTAPAPRPAPNDPPGPCLPSGLGADRPSEGNVAQSEKLDSAESEDLDPELDPDWISKIDALTGKAVKP